MRDSGLFAEVTASSRSDAPLRARIEVRMRVGRSAWGVLSAFLLFVPPAPLAWGEFEVKTSFLVDGQSRGVVECAEAYRVWGGLLSMFLMPFGRQEHAIFYDAIRATLLEARQRQLIQ
jgi:hypothetical protein